MDKPVIERESKPNQPPKAVEVPGATKTPSSPPSRGAAAGSSSYAWWLVLGLVGLDCFSTLGYLPTLAVEGAEANAAPLAAALIALLILFAALPVYLFVVGRSPHGTGVTGLMEKHLSGWSGKLFILFVLGFVATDFVITRSLSTADASKHLIANEYTQSGVEWLKHRKDIVHEALPSWLQGEWTKQFFAWWNEQLMVTVLLTLVGFALFFFLSRGFTRGFVYTAAAIVALFLVLNGVVIASSLVYIANHPAYLSNWMQIVGFASRNSSPYELFLDFAWLAVKSLPAVVLGLSGFELSMTVAPLVRGRPDDDPERPCGRIRNMRKLLVATAVLMCLLVPTSVASVSFLVPPGSLAKTQPAQDSDIKQPEDESNPQPGMMPEEQPAQDSDAKEPGDATNPQPGMKWRSPSARDRALSYLAHGGRIQPPGRRVLTDRPHETHTEDEDDEDIDVPTGDAEMAGQESTRKDAVLNPLFGPAFGTLYDVSAVLILILAGASVTVSLRDLLPRYLTRYGMEMDWANRTGVLLHLFNLIILVVVLVFDASVSHQQGAYATSVLVLLSAAALAASFDLVHRWRRSLIRDFVTLPLRFIFLIFFALACWVCYNHPAGLAITLLFVAVLLSSAAYSRWMRSTELRFYGFAYADDESGVRWEEIRRLEFQVLVPHCPDHQNLAEKEAEIRARHRLSSDVPIIFVEAELGDPSDFQQYPLMRIVKEDGKEVIRVSDCASIAHVLAAIALEFREVGRPPEIHFAWSNESPMASNLNFLLWGHGNVPWLVHSLIRKVEPDPDRQPRVVIG